MSRRGGSSNNGGGVQSIPAASRKMVQSLKEIVNCPEQEIYAMLKDCNMDPNEAVNRLLSQDPFHEVKSKREKKKENKDPTESRSRGGSGGSGATNRGGRGPTDRYVGRSSSNQFSASAESGAFHGKSAYKKENGTNAYTSSLSSASGVAGNAINRRPAVISDTVTSENKGSTTGTFDAASSSSSQPSSGYQSAWLGVPGQRSMADIVKMGRPHVKASTPNPSHQSVENLHVQAPPSPTAFQYNLPSSEGRTSKVSDMNISPDDEWTLVEPPPAASASSALQSPADSEQHDGINQQTESWGDDVGATEDGSVENLNTDFDEDLHGNLGSYQSHRHDFERDEVEDVGGSAPSVTTNLQQLSIEDDRGAASEEDLPSVVIPNHLQVQTADCSHLSFGSFVSGVNPFSGPFGSRPSNSNMEEESAEVDASSIGHSDNRNAEYYGDELRRPSADGNLVQIAGANAGNYDSLPASQPEALKQESPEAPHGNQYAFPSTPGYTFENAQQLNAGFSHSQTSSQMQNPYSSVMQAYTNSLPSALLAPTVQPVRESDLPYSPFLMTQSMPTKYGNTVSSIGSSAISMSEALKTASFSSTQPTPQTLAGTSVATGPALPQQLAVHPYSQPTLPLGPFANMISYPFLPQSYTYMPSAFQQAFAGNSTYHQSLTALLPQYKNSGSVSNLPQSGAIASGYGAFGNSASVQGNFPMNPSPAGPTGTTMGYDDVLSSQYKDNSHLISLQQNENSGMWVHGPGSRTMSAVPPSTYYSFQGQNQQPAGFRQAQQPSQNYGGALGYPNFYHSQTGNLMEHQQQQNPRDGSLSGSQGGQSSKQSQQQQLWQSTY